MKSKFITLYALITALLFITACNQGQESNDNQTFKLKTFFKQKQIFKEYHIFKNKKWQRINEDVIFEVEIKDTGVPCDITIPIRYADFYPYPYLEIGFNIYSPSGQESIDVKKVYLKNKDGKWQGSGMGDIWDYDFKIYNGYKFNEVGKYRFEIQNLTGNSYFLPGIMEIGLKINKTKK